MNRYVQPYPAGGMPPPYLPVRAAVMTDQRVSGAHVAFAWIAAVLTFGYMLPWAIAATRGKSNAGAVGLVNFFVGWTFIGWIAALVMACTAHQVMHGGPNVVVSTQHFPVARTVNTLVAAPGGPAPGWYWAPDGSGPQYWDGARWTIHRA